MFQKALQRQDFEAVLTSSTHAGLLRPPKKQHKLQLLISLQPSQSIADAAHILQEVSDRVEIKPLFPASHSQDAQEPTWRDAVFTVTVYNIVFEDISDNPWDIARLVQAKGNFIRVVPDVPPIKAEGSSHTKLLKNSGYPRVPSGWELRRRIGSLLRPSVRRH